MLSGAGWLLLLAADISNQSLQHDLSASVIWKTPDAHALWLRLDRPLWYSDIVGSCLGRHFKTSLARISRARPSTDSAGGSVLRKPRLGWARIRHPGNLGNIHRAADVAHLLAAGAWLGGLVPLASLLAKVRHVSELAFATKVTRRFSTLGLIAVGTILLTGVMNSYILVGSIAALTDTDYGRLLLVKLSLFGVMLSIAAVNRFRITPGLSNSRSGAIAARQLQRNSLVEAGFGLAILGIVGALGALPPGSHIHMM